MKLKRSDYPLVLRIMQGPCEQVCKVFLMEEDLGEEVTYDVNHHVHCSLLTSGAYTSSEMTVYGNISPLGGAVYQI